MNCVFPDLDASGSVVHYHRFVFVAAAAGAVIALAVAVACGAGGGSAGFGTGGKVRTDFGGNDGASAVALQEDGKIVVAGSTANHLAIARYLADGHLDRTFGVGGKVLADFPGDRLSAVAIQPDGKFVAAGASKGRFALGRYLADGRPDRSFGRDGRVATDIGGKARTESTWFDPDKWANVSAVTVQADGKIVAAGHSGPLIGLARYTQDGRLDGSFGRNGTVEHRYGSDDFSYAVAVAAQADRKIVIGAESGPSPGAGVLRFTRDGSVDESFEGGGFATWGSAIAIQRDGKIVAVGEWFDLAEGGGGFALGRFTSAGRPDSTFGVGGEVRTHFGPDRMRISEASAVAFQADGQIVAAGWESPGNPRERGNVAVARYAADGSLDPSFGTRGEVLTDFGSHEGASAIALQGDGKIVVAGWSKRDFMLARYNADGTLDS